MMGFIVRWILGCKRKRESFAWKSVYFSCNFSFFDSIQFLNFYIRSILCVLCSMFVRLAMEMLLHWRGAVFNLLLKSYGSKWRIANKRMSDRVCLCESAMSKFKWFLDHFLKIMIRSLIGKHQTDRNRNHPSHHAHSMQCE